MSRPTAAPYSRVRLSPCCSPKLRPRESAVAPSRHDYRISALQKNILLKPMPASDLAVAKSHGCLLRTLARQHTNPVSIGKRSRAAGETQRLHDINGPYQRKISGVIYLAD